MTWGEFKKAVEDKNIKDEDEIGWIDVPGYFSVDCITVEKELSGTAIRISVQ
jgi:hypothetical protein